MNPETVRRAHAVHPISALQSEYSLWERGVENGATAVCCELGITLVPYSPLGRSALTGRLRAEQRFADGDFRSTNPRFAPHNLARNLRPVEQLTALAYQKGCSPGQLAIAWLLAQPLDIVPIPGTKRRQYLRENVAATTIAISVDEIAYLSDVFAVGNISGVRYAAPHARTIT